MIKVFVIYNTTDGKIKSAGKFTVGLAQDGSTAEERIAQILLDPDLDAIYFDDMPVPDKFEYKIVSGELVELTMVEKDAIYQIYLDAVDDINQIINFNLDLDWTVTDLTSAIEAFDKIQTALNQIQIGMKNMAKIERKELAIIKNKILSNGYSY